MSLQAQIYDAIADEELGVAKVALPSGLDGGGVLTTVPRGVSLSMFYSVGLNLVHEGDGVLHLYKCHVNSLVVRPGTKIVLYDCKFLNKLELYGATGRIEGSDPLLTDETDIEGSVVCLTEPWVKIEEGSSVQFIKTTFKKTRGAKAVCEVYDSNAAFIQSRNIEEFHHCMKGERARIRLARSSFYSKYKCMEFSISSRLHISSCHLKGNEDMCLALTGSCTVTASDCTYLTAPDGFIPKDPAKQTKGLFGAGMVVGLGGNSSGYFQNVDLHGGDRFHDYGINCGLGSQAIFVSTNGGNDIKGGSFAAIFCSGEGSSVQVYNYRAITAQTEPGIICANGAQVVVSRARNINSDTQEAIRVSQGGKVEIESVQEVTGETWGAVLDEGSVLVVEGPTKLIEGAGDDALKIGDDCRVVIDDTLLISGNTAGARMGDRARLTLTNVPTLQASAGPGLTAGDECRVLLRIDAGLVEVGAAAVTGVIKGQTDGFVLGDRCRAIVMGYKTIEGETARGLVLGEETVLRTDEVELIQGLDDGARIGAGSSWTGRQLGQILSKTGYGVVGTGGKGSIDFEDVSLLEGSKGALHLLEGATSLRLVSVTKAHALLGDGVRFEGDFVHIDGMVLIKTDGGGAGGDGSGLVVKGAAGMVQNISTIDAFWAGAQFVHYGQKGCDVLVERIPLCSGLNSPHGVDLVLSTATFRSVNFVKDGLVSSATGSFYICTWGGALVVDKSTLLLSSCRVDGQFEITESSYDIRQTKMLGSHTATDTAGVSREYEQQAPYIGIREGAVHTNPKFDSTVELTDSSMKVERGELGGDVTAVSSTLKADSTTLAGQVTASASTIVGDSCEFGSGVDVSGSSSLELSSSIVSGSVTANAAGVVMRACNAGGVSLEGGSALLAESGSLGTVNVAGSSLQLYGSAATVNGLEKDGLICAPGYVVRGGTGKLYEAHTDEARAWFGKSYKMRTAEDMAFDVNAGHTLELNGTGGVRVQSSVGIALSSAPKLLDEEGTPPLPKEPEVVG